MLRTIVFLIAALCCTALFAENEGPNTVDSENTELRKRIESLEFKITKLEALIQDLASRVPENRMANVTVSPPAPPSPYAAPSPATSYPTPSQPTTQPPNAPVRPWLTPRQSGPSRSRVPQRDSPWQTLEINGLTFYIVPATAMPTSKSSQRLQYPQEEFTH